MVEEGRGTVRAANRFSMLLWNTSMTVWSGGVRMNSSEQGGGNIEHRTLNAEHRTNPELSPHSEFDVRSSMFDVCAISRFLLWVILLGLLAIGSVHADTILFEHGII